MSQSNPFSWVFSDQVVDPADILREVNPLALYADAPPAEANYRAADIQGVACAFCAKFSPTSYNEVESSSGPVMVPTGVCMLWESMVNGVKVCDRFADDGPALDLNGEEMWSEFSDVESPVAYHEVHLAGTTAPVMRDGKLVKGILRTGEWDVTPTPMGKLQKPLKIVKDGKSDPRAGIISLSEILDNFKNKRGVKRVQMPFSDKKNDDHIKDGNLARVNSGFVDDIWLEERNGVVELMAACDVRDPSVREGVINRTLEDVSSGIPFHPSHGAFLEHVCITNTPFIDGLSGWITASNNTPDSITNAEIVHHVLPSVETSTEPEAEPTATDETPEAEVEPAPEEVGMLSYATIIAGATAQLDEMGLVTSHYNITDATPTTVTVSHASSDTTWTATYTVLEGSVKLSPIAEWTVVENAGHSEPDETEESDHESDPTPVEAPRSTTSESDPARELEAARNLRLDALVASAQSPITSTGGATMTVISREELDRLELSDDVRARILETLDENDTLKATGRTQACDARIEELKGFGFSDRPGFLKLYRDIFLSDDGGPAAIVLSDDGSKASLSARQILDNAIDALRGSEGKIEFSDQHTQSGNDDKPPVTDGPDAPVEERVKNARSFLFPNGR